MSCMVTLNYEPLNDSHADSLLFIWSDDEVIRYTSILSPCTLAEIKARHQTLKAFDVFIVRKGDAAIGIIGCPCIDLETQQYGLFYQFCRSSWGHGYGREAAVWLLDFMRKNYQKVTLYADVLVENIASEHILKHLGFQLISEEEVKRNEVNSTLRHYRLCVS